MMYNHTAKLYPLSTALDESVGSTRPRRGFLSVGIRGPQRRSRARQGRSRGRQAQCLGRFRARHWPHGRKFSDIVLPIVVFLVLLPGTRDGLS